MAHVWTWKFCLSVGDAPMGISEQVAYLQKQTDGNYERDEEGMHVDVNSRSLMENVGFSFS